MNTKINILTARLMLVWSLVVFSNPGFGQEPLFENEDRHRGASELAGHTQNAVLEGIQISSEPGQTADEKVITGYFIFRDKPTSYFYEANLRENKIIFDFNDCEMGASPIPSQKVPPINGFRIEQIKININADIQGLNPEWHDVVRVSLFMDGIPEITVKDEYSIVSFSFTWSTDPSRAKEYTQRSNTPKVFLFSSLGLAAIGGGILAYVLTRPPEDTLNNATDGPLSTNDLPKHPPLQ
jgi:hypothetical protein